MNCENLYIEVSSCAFYNKRPPGLLYYVLKPLKLTIPLKHLLEERGNFYYFKKYEQVKCLLSYFLLLAIGPLPLNKRSMDSPIVDGFHALKNLQVGASSGSLLFLFLLKGPSAGAILLTDFDNLGSKCDASNESSLGSNDKGLLFDVSKGTPTAPS